MATPNPYEQWIFPVDRFQNPVLINENAASGSLYVGDFERPEAGRVEKLVFRNVKTSGDEGRTPQSFMREFEILINIHQHPCLNEFVGYNFIPQPTIVMKYCPNGNLQDAVKKKRNWFNGTVRAKAIYGIACGLMHFHSYNAVHRYLKPSNILFDENYHPVISDFGRSKIAQKGNNQDNIAATKIKSQPGFQAPELVENDTPLSNKVDVFSFGSLMYYILTGQEPFEGESEFKVINNFKNAVLPPFPDNMDRILKSIITHCWDVNPLKRPAMANIVLQLRNFDELMFPDQDSQDYDEFRDRMYVVTRIEPRFKKLFNAPKVDSKDVPKFNAALAQAKTGDIKSQLEVAKYFDSGIGTVRDVKQAFYWYSKAAESKNSNALYFVGCCYESGKEGIPQDYEKAAESFRLAMEDKRKHIMAQVRFAMLLAKGLGVEQNIPEATNLLKEAAKLPDGVAKYQYASILIANQPTPETVQEAINFYKDAASCGIEAANCDLAFLNLDGIPNVYNQNIAEGIRLMKQAADRGLVNGQYNYGLIKFAGKYNQARDVNEGFQYFKLAADKDHFDSCARIGNCYEKGLGCNQDPQQAEQYYRKAATGGSKLGQHNLGAFLRERSKATQNDNDLREAANWFKKAADQGVSPSMVELAKIYISGIVTPSPEKAKQLLKQAAELGNPNAAAELQQLEQRFG